MPNRNDRRPWGFAGWRWELLGAVRGPALEIGCGFGRNFAHYPPEAAVTAFDLDAERVTAAQLHAQRLRAPERARIRLAVGNAEHLAWPNRTFEAVTGTLVFCSIPHPAQALDEVRRVLRPGGRLYLVEHVRSDRPWLAALQDALAPAWHWATGGCNLNRDTAQTLRTNGFEIEQLKTGLSGVLNLIIARPR
jgi:ubiquinone/menaquinone biosynthesis C-methylase UbiE